MTPFRHSNRTAILASVGAVVELFAWTAVAEDVDRNNIQDDVEQQLASRFKPAFIMHRDNITIPEPVEILSQQRSPLGTGLLASDLWVRRFDVTGAELQPVPYSISGFAGSPMYYSYDGGSLSEPGRPPGHSAKLILDYGGPGNEVFVNWSNTYLYDSVARSRADPTVYARLVGTAQANHWVMQYWMYYPFDDWLNKHEGDWEHISVHFVWIAPSQAVDQATITRVTYFVHEDYIAADPAITNIHLLDGVHPVVYVGGFGDARGCCSCAPANDAWGNHSGASYPAPGNWDVANGIPVGCSNLDETLQRGRFVSPDQVNAVWMPDVNGVDANYWTSNPGKQWMKADLQWGHAKSPSPLSIGNESPRGPFFHNDSDFQPYPHPWWNTPLLNHHDQFYVQLQSGATVLVANIGIGNPANPTTKVAPTFAWDGSAASQCGVVIPKHVAQDGMVYEFVAWDDDNTSLCRTFFVSETRLARAHYRPAFQLATTLFPTGGARAAAWGDFNSDGSLDLVIADQANPCYLHLYHGNGAGGFTEVSPGGMSEPLAAVVSLACADFDNDGRLDLLVNTTANKRVFRNRGAAGFSNVASGQPIENLSLGTSATWADYDRDGWLDVLYTNSLNVNRLIRNAGPAPGLGTLSEDWSAGAQWSWTSYTQAQLGPSVGAETGGARTAAWADFNKDGRSDFFLSNQGVFNYCNDTDPPNRLLRNYTGVAGAPSFAMVNALCSGVSPRPLASARAYAAAWGDVEMNATDPSYPDLVLANSDGVKLFENARGVIELTENPNAESVTDSIQTVLRPDVGLPATGDYRGVSSVDFDNDGDLDLCLARVDSTFLYENIDASYSAVCNESGVQGFFHRLAFGASSQVPGAFAWGDYDNDGDMDLFIPGPDGGCRVWRNECRNQASGGSHANYLALELIGTRSNRSAIGARVKVTTTGVGAFPPVYREITANSNGSSVNALKLIVGLGAATTVSQVEIAWPSGKTETLTGLPVNSALVRTEPVQASVLVSMPRIRVDGPSLTCPGGDGVTMTTSLAFVDVPARTVGVHELKLGVPPDGSGIKFYPENGACGTAPAPYYELALAPATSANGFTTSFVKSRIGGRGVSAVPILWNGVVIATAPISVVSPDNTPTSPGYVDASDLARLAIALGSRRDNPPPNTPAYLPGGDLNDDGVVDAGDIASIAVHLTHGCRTTGGPGKAVSLERRVQPEVPAQRVLTVSPNPFNPTTAFVFTLDVPMSVRLWVADVRGRVVRNLLDGRVSAGQHRIAWDGRDDAGLGVSSGIYICSIQTPNGSDARRLAVVR